MSVSFVTIVAPVERARIDEMRARIERLGAPVGAALDASRVIHFASIHVFEASTGEGGHLVVEMTGDGDEDAVLKEFVRAVPLGPVVELAGGPAREPERWLRARKVTPSRGLLGTAGLPFFGTPGLTVERIQRERELEKHLRGKLAAMPAGSTAKARLDEVRRTLGAFEWAMTPEPALALEPAPNGGAPLGTVEGLKWGAAFLLRLLWPLLLIPGIAGLMTWRGARSEPHAILFAAMAAVLGTLAALAIAALLVGIAYRALRRREELETPVDRPPDPDRVRAIMERENRCAQNHLAALFVMKPGPLRGLLLRTAFWFVRRLAERKFRPGFLADIGTIHSARWVLIPGTRDLLFLSNYGGSWESYLEDFITKAAVGLTGIWSNTVDFPKSRNLFFDGATDGDRFKRWARRWQVPQQFWYSAYPDLTTSHVRRNAAVRQGLACALTEEEARAWLSLFGSAPRTDGVLETSQIQSLVFGGFKFLPHGTCLLVELPESRSDARAFVAELLPDVAFGEGRKLALAAAESSQQPASTTAHRFVPDRATIVGLAASGLRKLGLEEDAVTTFPPAFLDGMTAPHRSRILGDVGDNDPKRWSWGREGEPDAALLLYAVDEPGLKSLADGVRAKVAAHGGTVVQAVPFVKLPDDNKAPRNPFREPFGFVDGVSQPVIRGTYKASRVADPIHVVEAGEFVLGYPDNRGHVAPGPSLRAQADPEGRLPIRRATTDARFDEPVVSEARELGRNGTFLVIRHFVQHVDAFESWCEEQAASLSQRFPSWGGVTPEFVKAKLVGRWQDGTSIVRSPYMSGTDARAYEHETTRVGSSEAQGPADAIPSPRSLAVQAQAPTSPVTPRAARPDNDFAFGEEDPQGLKCPFGAHVRRANPRDSFAPGSKDQIAITNRHRILRVGRMADGGATTQGLFFMCLNGDIERQFEFVQQTWIESPTFHGLSDERDPVLGSRQGSCSFTMPTRQGPVRLEGLPPFVQLVGGGYFFVPGRQLLEYLAG